MRSFLTRIIAFLLVGSACAWAEGDKAGTTQARPAPEDMKIIAVMEILQMMDMTEEMEMIKDLEYLIEDDRDERTTD